MSVYGPSAVELAAFKLLLLHLITCAPVFQSHSVGGKNEAQRG